MDLQQLEKALRELPIDTLLTEIPELQNSLIHLIQSNKDMKEFDPEGTDPDLTLAIKENKDLIKRYDKRIDLILEVIRDRVNEAAATEMGSTVDSFREKYMKDIQEEDKEALTKTTSSEEGVYL
ncbi:hypothetical protein BJ944DRAFT_270616 [Cunninghamella echinulata]|nr:hypothetical protein BJ944DRAFT_270616 [Cunninghamella echinulata]